MRLQNTGMGRLPYRRLDPPVLDFTQTSKEPVPPGSYDYEYITDTFDCREVYQITSGMFKGVSFIAGPLRDVRWWHTLH